MGVALSTKYFPKVEKMRLNPFCIKLKVFLQGKNLATKCSTSHGSFLLPF